MHTVHSYKNFNSIIKKNLQIIFYEITKKKIEIEIEFETGKCGFIVRSNEMLRACTHSVTFFMNKSSVFFLQEFSHQL